MQILNKHEHDHTRFKRRKLEKAIYDDRINVALELAERDVRTLDVKRSLRIGISRAVERISKPTVIERLVKLIKSPSAPLINEVRKLLVKTSIENYVDLEIWLIWAGSQGGQAALDKLNIDVDGMFRLTNPNLVDFFARRSNLLIKDIDDYTAEWLASQITTGKEEGLTPQEIAYSIADQSNEFSEMRAKRIVDTELANALVKIELEAAERYGIREVIWRTSQDEIVCPICFPLEGEVVDIKGTFNAVAPRKTKPNVTTKVEGPPAHVSCRCFLEEVVPDDWEIPEYVWMGA